MGPEIGSLVDLLAKPGTQVCKTGANTGRIKGVHERERHEQDEIGQNEADQHRQNDVEGVGEIHGSGSSFPVIIGLHLLRATPVEGDIRGSAVRISLVPRASFWKPSFPIRVVSGKLRAVCRSRGDGVPASFPRAIAPGEPLPGAISIRCGLNR